MPNSATPELRKFAGRLLDYEVGSSKPADAEEFAAFRVCDKLRGPLGKLLGVGGFRALLSRALAMAGAEVPWLSTLYIKEDSALEGLDALKAELDSRSVAEGEVALAAHLLGLLVTFIGPALTVRLLHDIWPKLDDPNF